jgi:Xaa-Pro aminopeptidase
MMGMAPKVKGYAGVFGHTLPVSGGYSNSQRECLKHMAEVFNLTKEQLIIGKGGREIDTPGRAYFEKHGLLRYLVCPFAHTIGLHEAESPFFGPNSNDVLKAGMTVCVDISLFGHPDWNGGRIETGFEITDKGTIPLSPKMNDILSDI